ncbi:ROK family transcriptional regulator [Heyndrickxia acidicola]|uniref:ROK family transcriptional regulator n=1 Tax=Heyndrickxia acidicola TaxID=209389 RepID=A0ABU6MCS2_9BACI|nr:ROK family transcriptional regulator [Heyndrickxia acidicola]MED1201816.1 ROK family transcriptional regulator [Heyndrickxia acidicola]
MDTADQTYIKTHNQRILLDHIIQHHPISRADLSKMTRLNKATVSSQTASLMEKELIYEIGTGISSGGRRPVMLEFNKNAGYVIGVDLGVHYILTLLTDLEGNILFHDYVETSNPSIESIKPILIERIELIAKMAPPSPYGIIGIGVGVHGFVNNDELIVLTPHSKWKDVELKTTLESHFHCPVLIENEANAGAYGEKLFGAIKNCSNCIFVSVGMGIGVGIIMNGELYRGTEGFSGEMGHMTIDLNGGKCGCGNYGCWELYASEGAFFKKMAALKNLDEMNLEQISKLIQEHDGEAMEELEKFGYYLGIGLTNIINTFNPEAVVLRSNFIESNPIVLNSIQNTISARITRYVHQSHQIYLSQLHRNATALGAASFVIHHFLMESDHVSLKQDARAFDSI